MTASIHSTEKFRPFDENAQLLGDIDRLCTC